MTNSIIMDIKHYVNFREESFDGFPTSHRF